MSGIIDQVMRAEARSNSRAFNSLPRNGPAHVHHCLSGFLLGRQKILLSAGGRMKRAAESGKSWQQGPARCFWTECVSVLLRGKPLEL
jgi:hypothetical protein